MELGMLFPDEVNGIVKNKLKNGWIMIAGDTDGFYNVENNVYPPKTELNKYFELYMHPNFPGGAFALCKKTKELKKHFDKLPDYERTIAIWFIKKVSEDDKSTSLLLKQVYMKEGIDATDSIDRFVNENIY